MVSFDYFERPQRATLRFLSQCVSDTVSTGIRNKHRPVKMMLTLLTGLIVAVLTDVSTAGPLVQTLDGRIEGKTERFKEKDYLKVDKKIDVFRVS